VGVEEEIKTILEMGSEVYGTWVSWESEWCGLKMTMEVENLWGTRKWRVS